MAHQIEREVAYHRHVLGAMAGAKAGLVLIEGHIKGPMQVVLDGPVASHGIGESCGRERARRDVGSALTLNLVSSLNPALDHADRSEFREAGCPRVGALGSDPIDTVGDSVGS